ncbi:methyltransferase domain-containing protein [Methylacidiphilum caldifontis]|uniref:class I SAM-dependent methyltransferase n=1 Tax=Methylacidiphilum caldifontis TaxID=2795386 RepID=UPI001A8E1FA9|nr:methyltransferase domain-containing protein [Methylacidiphilum caldifontis]QSR89240.1 methyltransferase domain-containing protein [Methylacidiphilum caldifontis]
MKSFCRFFLFIYFFFYPGAVIVCQPGSYFYDSFQLASEYDKLSNPQFIQGKKLVSLLKIKKGQKVLDIGCGTGRLAAYVAEITGREGTVIGIDPSPFRIDIARRREKENLKFKVASTEDLYLFKDNYFDVIYLNSVFHWIDNKPQAIADIYRLLKVGGKLGIAMGAKQQNLFLMSIVRKSVQSVLGYVPKEFDTTEYRREAEEAQGLVLESGFKILETKTQNYIDLFKTGEELIRFYESSSGGSLLREFPDFQRKKIISHIEQALDRLKTPKGIAIPHSILFLICEKPK